MFELDPRLLVLRDEIEKEIVKSVREKGRASTVEAGARMAANVAVPFAATAMAVGDMKLLDIEHYINSQVIYANTVIMTERGASPAALEVARLLNEHVARIVLDIRAILEREVEDTVRVNGADGYDIPTSAFVGILAKNALDKLSEEQ